MKRVLILLLLALPFITLAQHELFKKDTFVSDSGKLPYRVMFPENFDESKQYPLVLVLHGAGERGDNNESQLTHGSKLFEEASNRAEFPAIVVFPQCPKESYWSNVKKDRSVKPIKLKFYNGGEPTEAMQLLTELIADLEKRSYIDANKMYVGGLSMGGMGTFELLYRKPNTFAAAFAICGGGNPKLAKQYAHVPMWIFHGAHDDVVAPQNSIVMVDALVVAGAFPQFYLYQKDNHNSWDSAFSEPNLLPWIFSQSK